MTTIRLTMAQALARAMAAQLCVENGQTVPVFAGVWAIFGHGNVAGFGEALHSVRDRLPTFRGHNEQAMAHAAIAYAKAKRCQRMMAVTTSIGPGATNLVTAAALAHVNRLPVLLLPGDVFATRRPDPVLQQIENESDATVSANDCLRPVSRYFDRITRPEQLIPAFARAVQVLMDPGARGPVTLALCQDVQTEAYEYPSHMFEPRIWTQRRPPPDAGELGESVRLLREAKRPLVIAGGGVLYSRAEAALLAFCRAHGVPMCETQAGKSSLPWSEDLNMGAIGVTGTQAANALAAEADVILAVGTRLADFTTGSWALFGDPTRHLIGLNVTAFDAGKHRAQPLAADALVGLESLGAALAQWRAPSDWTARAVASRTAWLSVAAAYTAASDTALPTDAQVLGAVQRQAQPNDIVMSAAGGLPGEMHKLWLAEEPGGYHMEYGFSTMGYEIAGGLGVKLAEPGREVFVLLGDGSYLMMNSEIATSVMMGLKLTIVVLDNGGFGCINRLQKATGGAAFNNLLADAVHEVLPEIDIAGHARALGALAEKVAGLAALEAALVRARAQTRTCVLVIDTDPQTGTDAGGAWWDVAVPEVSDRDGMELIRARYLAARAAQRIGN